MLLITGGTGLLGARLLYDLATGEDSIRAMRGLSGDMSLFERYCADRPELADKVEWLDGDILDPNYVHDAVMGCSKVYHCAALVSFDPSEKKKMYDINVRGTANIVNSCIENKVDKLCYASSVAAIGREKSGSHISEESRWVESKLNTNYAVSKYNAELEVWRGITEGLNAVMVNPTVILGRGNWTKGSAALFKRIWDGIPFCPPGRNGFVDVRDVSKAMCMLMNSDIHSERFILCSENVSFQELIANINTAYNKDVNLKPAGPLLMELVWRGSWLISKISGKKQMITKETVRTSSNRFYYSSEKIQKMLDFNFIPLEETAHYTAGMFLKDQGLL